MLCCNRCGDMITSGKCRKCGGRAVASIFAGNGISSVRGAAPNTNTTITTAAAAATATATAGDAEEGENQIKILDKWQNQYASGILGSKETVFDTKEQSPLISRASMNNGTFRTRRNSSPQNIMMGKQRPLSLVLQRSCAHCNMRLRLDTQSFLENGSHYCKPCHTDLFSKGTCSVCEKLVFPQRDTFIEHKTSVWHKDCFRCHECLVDVSDMPIVDLRGRPCCERCLMSQAGASQKKGEQKYAMAKVCEPPMPPPLPPVSSTATTPSLVKQPSDTLSSAGSIFSAPGTPPPSRPRIDSQLFQHYQKSFHHQLSPDLTSSPPPLSPVGSVRSSLSGSPLSITPSTSPLSIQTRFTPPPLKTTAPHAPSPVTQQQQRQHEQVLVSPSRSELPENKRICAKCKDPIKGRRIKLTSATNQAWYHYDCLKCAGCHTHFKDSNISTVRDAIYHHECVPPTEIKRLDCHTCQKAIKGRFVSCNAKNYHTECFQCHRCHTTLDYEQPYYEVRQEPHCESCARRRPTSPPRPFSTRQAGGSTSTPILSTQRSFDHPSSVMMNRTRALPKLGGSTYCPRCHKSVPITDNVPGPKNTRWHKKCLRCIGCNKQMDSGTDAFGDSNNGHYVQCRMCRYKDGASQKYVR